MKKGQIAIVAIVAVLLVVIFGLFLKIRSSVIETNFDKVKKDFTSMQHNLDFLNSFYQDCLKKVSQKAITLSSYQGGYIDPQPNYIYGDYSDVPFTEINMGGTTLKIPIYYDGSTEIIPTLTDIGEKIARYTIVEFAGCVEPSNLYNDGYISILPESDYDAVNFDFSQLDVNSYASINKDDITVQIYYPARINKKNTTYTLDNFLISQPSRLNNISNYIIPILNSIKLDQPVSHNAFCTAKLNLENNIFNGEVNIIVVPNPPNEYIIRFSENNNNIDILRFAVSNVVIDEVCS
ncbi:MAG: hypothetical protein ABIC04_03155 [Nanoarchaeota archaeon]